MDGALAAIRVARTTVCPFVGTCGGCQHVVIEYARHVLGVVDDAQHAEYDPYASRLFITPLSCSLAGRTMRVFLIPGSRSHASYGCAVADEQ
jgi:CTP synthase (UTP-ammonia lyase)